MSRGGADPTYHFYILRVRLIQVFYVNALGVLLGALEQGGVIRLELGEKRLQSLENCKSKRTSKEKYMRERRRQDERCVGG